MPHMFRTHTCGELNASHDGESVTLNGWVDSTRLHGSLVFIDVRDRYGVTQVVFDESEDPDLLARARELHLEYCIAVRGVVRRRPDGLVNPDRATGEIEVLARELRVFSKAKPLPFVISDPETPGEDVRMRYRFLDLRRPAMQEAMGFRSRFAHSLRRFMESEGFLEIETPFLARSTPEGARDYLVPSRVNPGKFYALPQSPQQFKQLLMVGGCDRYYQLARCFRDEDLRADRQPEFTQIDIEMAFAGRDEVLDLSERLMAHTFRDTLGVELSLPFPRMSYAEALERFASDKPDLRFDIEVATLNDLFAETDFRVFRSVIEGGGLLRGMRVPGCASWSRKMISSLERVVLSSGAKGMAWLKFTAEGAFEGPIAKFVPAPLAARVAERLGAEKGDLLCFVADEPQTANVAMANLRKHVGRELELYDPSRFVFLWVLDFPLFKWDEEEGRYVSEHHPFTSPVPQDPAVFDRPLEQIPSASYDLVLNGEEIASGSQRIHDPEVQRRVFEVLKLGEEEIRRKFGFFIDALAYGTPPHAGIAFGYDRIISICLGRDSIREVIAFPKNTRAVDMMTGAPSEVDPAQLAELRIRLDLDGN